MIAVSISFSNAAWTWPLLVAGAVVAALVVAGYLRSPVARPVKTVCAALKLVGIAALLLCLLEPLWSRPRARKGANDFLVLADNSQGLRIRDRGAKESRGEGLKKELTETSPWQQALADHFQVRRAMFDSRLQNVEGFEDLDFNGGASAIHSSLRRAAERFRGQPLAGVLLFTDGNATDADLSMDAAGLPPVYPVMVGEDSAPDDVSLRKLAVNETAFEDAPVTMQADVSASGYSGTEIVAQLLDGSGRKLDELNQRADGANAVAGFRFRVKPKDRGTLFYTVRVLPGTEPGAATNAAASHEATLANNARTVVVDRGRGPYRILFVAGRPTWEYKFLNRALAEDDQLNLVGLIRIAKREPKFEFMARRGETVNPLFRGFGQTNEDTERYDQPVLSRLNTRDELELKGGFPKTAEELYAYHAIIFGDIESSFFTRDQMTLVQKFVSERGGGFLMLGGSDSFREGRFERTPVGDMLPVYLDRTSPVEMTKPVKFALSREGWLQPWTRVSENEAGERARIEAMPAFAVLNEAHAVKPGASVLAAVTDAKSRSLPALVAQRFGNGRSAALLVGDFWRWGFLDEAKHREMDKTWRQMMRWLVTDVPNRIDLRVVENPGEQTVSLQVRAREKNFQPLDNATVRLAVRPAGNTNATNVVTLPAEAANEAGLYQATFVPREPGGYRVEATVLDANGTEAGRAEAGWASDPAAEEFRSLKPNHAFLEQLARRTGGEVVAMKNLEQFVKSLPERKAPVLENVPLPLWHTPAMFLFALACFAGEWGIRRWKGLA